MLIAMHINPEDVQLTFSIKISWKVKQRIFLYKYTATSHLGFVYMGSLALCISQQSRSTISMIFFVSIDTFRQHHDIDISIFWYRYRPIPILLLALFTFETYQRHQDLQQQ